MGLNKLSRTLTSSRLQRASTVSIGIDAALALLRGETRLGALLLGVTILASRFTALGVVAHLVIHFYRRRR